MTPTPQASTATKSTLTPLSLRTKPQTQLPALPQLLNSNSSSSSSLPTLLNKIKQLPQLRLSRPKDPTQETLRAPKPAPLLVNSRTMGSRPTTVMLSSTARKQRVELPLPSRRKEAVQLVQLPMEVRSKEERMERLLREQRVELRGNSSRCRGIKVEE